jgi:hypothetical protein
MQEDKKYLKERLISVLDHFKSDKNLDDNLKIANALKLKSKTYISDLKKGTKPLNDKLVDSFRRYLNVNPQYLEGASEQMFLESSKSSNAESITLDQMTALYSSLIKALKDINSNVLATLQVTQENNSLAHAALVSHAEIRGKSAADIQHKLDDSLKYAKGYLEKFYGSSSENRRDHVKKVH